MERVPCFKFQVCDCGVDHTRLIYYTVTMNLEAKLYELFCLVNAESEEETDIVNNLARKYIENNKGVVLETASPVKRWLAYPIQKSREAYFWSVKFYLSPSATKGLEEILRREKQLTRFILARSQRTELETRRRGSSKFARQEEKPAADISLIDKKLEEILGA